MKENVLISIVVPVYNAEKCLDKCIESIVNQSYQNLEIILVDDGSNDSSPLICDKWADRDSRITVRHKENGGAASARNLGIEISSGELIGFVDSDDYISDTMIEELANALVLSEKEISYCRILRVDALGEETEITHKNKRTVCSGEEAVKALLEGGIITSFCNKLFKKNIFIDIKFPEGEINEEYSLWIPILMKCNGIVGCDSETAVYYYRITEGSVTTVCIESKENTGILYKNLLLIKNQIKEYNLKCGREYNFFVAENTYMFTLALEKKYKKKCGEIKSNYKKYKRLMWKYCFNYIFSFRTRLKDKILYALILSGLLRPLYSIFYKKHLKY